MRKTLLILILCSPIMVQAQIWAGINAGPSITTVNPQEINTFEQSSEIDSATGRDFAVSFSADLTEKIRAVGRLSYNQSSAYVFHRYIEAQDLENQTDGSMSSQYLGLYLAPVWHKGSGLEFQYGLGFYTGFLMNSSFTGVYRVKKKDDIQTFIAKDAPADSYRNMATGLFTTLGLNLNISPKIQANLNADIVLFLNGKNIIFEDTGSVNEINIRLGVSYLFEKREE